MPFYTVMRVSWAFILIGYAVLGQLGAWRQIHKHGLVGLRRRAFLAWQTGGDAVGIGAIIALLTTHSTDGLGHPAPAIWAEYLLPVAIVFIFVALARKQRLIAQAKLPMDSTDALKMLESLAGCSG